MSKKTKWTKKGPRRWEMGDYAVEASYDVNDGKETVFTATVRGSDGVDAIGAARADGTKGSLVKARKRAQQCCEEHLAGAETEPDPAPEQLAEPERFLLDWQEDESDGTWVARGPDGDEYLIDECDEEIDEMVVTSYWPKHGDSAGEEGLWQNPGGWDTPEEAKELCQWHVDTTLRWVRGDQRWTAETLERHTDPDDGHDLGPVVYAIDPAPDAGTWYCQLYTDPVQNLEPAASLELAQEHCQDHHRKRNPPPTPAKAPPGTDVAARKSGQLPAPQRAEWTIPVPLSPEEMVAAFEEGRKLRRKKRRLQAEVAAAHDAYKKLAKRNQELIDKLEEEIEELDEHMPLKAVDSIRSYVRDDKGDVWVHYRNPDTGRLCHEDKLDRWGQRQLFGEGDPPPDKPPAKPWVPPLKWEEADDDPDWEDEVVARSGPYRITVSADGSCIVAKRDDEELYAVGNVAARDLPERITEARDVCAEDAQRRNCNGGPVEPEANPRLLLPADLDLRPTKAWRPVEGSHPDGSRKAIYYAGDPDGEHYAHWRDLPKKSGGSGLWYLTFAGPTGTREIGRHASGQSARTCAHADNQTRLRWPPLEPGQQIIACGPYQLARASDHPDDDPEQDDWQIAYVAPGLDGKAADLGTHTGLTAAQDACQAHAAGLRATEAAS